MADKYVNQTDLAYYHGRLKTLFATTDYVDEHGGKIDAIKVNGIEQGITDKAVDLNVPQDFSTNTTDYLQTEVYRGGFVVDFVGTIPTRTSELTNDGNDDGNGPFQTTEEVVETIYSHLQNGSDPYQTKSEVTTAIDEAIAGVTQFEYEIVDALPATGKKGTIYLVPDAVNPEIYDEYIYLDSRFEQIGKTGEVDLSEYWAKTELVAMTTAEIDALFA